jgi:hypothetical protein
MVAARMPDLEGRDELRAVLLRLPSMATGGCRPRYYEDLSEQQTADCSAARWER